jgi:hypothetical protein
MAFTKITSTNIEANTVAGYAEFANFANSLAPKVSSIAITSNTYSVLDDTAVNVGGGFVVVTGSNFQSGASVLIDTTPATSVSYIDSTTLRAQVPARSAASYNLYVVNPDGGTGIKVSGITYSGTPTWVTASPLANVLSNVAFSNTFSATGAVSYANTTILPTGFNLLANGYYFGNISIGETQTTYSFNVRATDAENQESDKTFSLTTVNVPPTYTLNYLLLAGGGGGGYAGGGAGGFLSGSTTVNKNQTYTLSIGGGGNGVQGNYPTSDGVGNGTNTTAFDQIAWGGGGGGNGGTPQPGLAVGRPGGSGGGGYRTFIPGPNATFNREGGVAVVGSPQGYPGGTGGGNINGQAGGGGGGANGSGTNASNNPLGFAFIGGNGGNGRLWPFNGQTHAAGGGGSGYGPGSPGTNGPGNPGSAGSSTNGGWGSGGSGTGNPGNPGSIYLAIPTPSYPGSAPPGASVSTPPSAPGMTVLSFYSSDTYTA